MAGHVGGGGADTPDVVCVIPGKAVKVFGKAVHTLSRLSDDLYVEASPTRLALRTVCDHSPTSLPFIHSLLIHAITHPLSLTHSLNQSSITHSPTHPHSPNITRSLIHTHTHTYTHTHTHTHTHTLSLSQLLTARTRTRSHTHAHTHTCARRRSIRLGRHTRALTLSRGSSRATQCRATRQRQGRRGMTPCAARRRPSHVLRRFARSHNS